MGEPVLIQGGMGVGVSNWQLARAVSRLGQLGVVSGTFLDNVFARRLQDGDDGGHLRRALQSFPDQAMAARVLNAYFIAGGKEKDQPYKSLPMFSLKPPMALLELTVLANFAEVFLAREGHDGLVGINYLEKIQTPTLPSLYGAMLAGVDYVLMGAGIPKAIPGLLDCLSGNERVSMRLAVEESSPEDVFELTFDPRSILPEKTGTLKRPKFLAIVSSVVLATTLARKSSGRVDGFIVEFPPAGGHNAPPRGAMNLNEHGEPVYGERDQVNLEKIAGIGLPYWLAGSYGSPEKLREALSLGAQGVQVGTPFAFCRESGITDQIKKLVSEKVGHGTVNVFTDPRASSSGYPFKVVQLEDSLSEPKVFDCRPRVCDLGYLRTAFKREDGSVGFRCPAEPVDEYTKKGGNVEDTSGRKCLCNGLLATVGLPQVQKSGYVEKALVTAGACLPDIGAYFRHGEKSYSAEDVVTYILQPAARAASSSGKPSEA